MFIIMLIVMLFDVDSMYRAMSVDAKKPAYVERNDVLYAGDTMLASAHPLKLQILLNLMIGMGNQCGLNFTWDNIVTITIYSDGDVRDPSV